MTVCKRGYLFALFPLLWAAGVVAEIERLPGVPVQAIVETAKPTPQRDAWDLPDLRGEYDHLIPVAEDYPLPERPSRLHDVATMRDGRYLRPRIPAALTTNDGRIGVGLDMGDGWDGKPGNGYLHFMLFVPEKLDAKGIHYTQAEDGSLDFMSDKVWRVPYTELMPGDHGLKPWMFAVCDTSYAGLDNELYGDSNDVIHRNPYPVSENEEAYDIEVFGGDYEYEPIFQSTDRTFSFTVRLIVRNPKTPAAEIVRIERVGEVKIATLPFRPFTIFEPNITGDGRFIITRISGTPAQGGAHDSLQPRPWVDAEGNTHYSQHDIVYAYNPPGSGIAPCDPNGWTNLKPISYAHHDPEIRERYGFAKFPLRDSEGKVLAPGQESGITYPWIDRRGSNIMFTMTRRSKASDETTFHTPEDVELVESAVPFESLDAGTRGELAAQAGVPGSPERRPNLMLPMQHQVGVPGKACDSCPISPARGHASTTRGVGIAGLWTQGKIILADGIINAMDLGYSVFENDHKLARLYHGTPGKGGVIRIGNGRTNISVPDEIDLDSFWPYNDTMMESLENKVFHSKYWKPAAPQDIVWTINDGRGSTEFAFDDYMDNRAVILSSMVESTTTMSGPVAWIRSNTGDRAGWPLRVQNAATGLGKIVPSYGEIFGDTKQGTRIEPVALGGVFGKGLWLNQRVGVRYHIPPEASAETQSITTAYYGIFVDPRFELTDGTERSLLTTPTGNVLFTAKGGRPQLLLRSADRYWSERITLPENFGVDKWTHFGIEVANGTADIYVNGFFYAEVDLRAQPGFLRLTTGDIVVGSPDGSSNGIRGWIDNFNVFSRPLINAEEACNHSMGSMVRLDQKGRSGGFPVEGHKRIARALGEPAGTRYVCHTDYQSEGFAFLARLDEGIRVGKALRNIKPLRFDEPRPQETDNAFCMNCHADAAHPARSMSIFALIFESKPMQLDRRRQPSQPYPAATGHIPANWLDGINGKFPSRPLVLKDAGEWLFLDEGLLQ